MSLSFLRLSSIKLHPKQVFIASSFHSKVADRLKPVVLSAIYDLGVRIENGFGLPEEVYRQNRDTTPDNILEKTGIMHVHPLGPGTSELLFLIQYDPIVIFLEVSDHHHFQILPPGHLLTAVHNEAIKYAISVYESLIEQRRTDFFES